MTNSAAPEEPKYWVKSVARAADILEALAAPSQGNGLSVTEVGQACSISKSAAFGMLQTLRAYGLVSDDGEGMNRRYRLGMSLARLGDRARSQVSLRGVAHPVLRDLTRATGMASRLAVPEDGHAVVVDQVELDQRVRLDLRMGQRELPHCTGLGKALLSAMPQSEAASVIERFGLPRRTSRTITDPATFLSHLRDIARVGYALDDEEDAEGIICIGAPVFDDRSVCAGAVSITGLKLGLPAWRYQELGGQVRDAARRISVSLGWVEDPEPDASDTGTSHSDGFGS
ncbi:MULTISPECIES: IclR family transcriptional regulator [Streptomyces]|uniref:IclR family transcriptional regulator n=1 Tax=Streptomyces poriferorum TaxID=2798799 RepID=A0ABY9J0E0_9ACTN|nr:MULTISPECIES: IclR family transcriptional regulator [Streptomyces]MBW5254014.1 IclR family transcriptional regulator [Streptomyces poriferorum]MBW5262029.1 IclR family transcriptional regulator [Streptomyces poriferorum]MDP5310675.1 IclR family transcriptional regulator [Streptomyces sp. Alt4]WLQ60176.1 IclR family transcriptional regulator [Streptomyces sp. Alt2]WSI61949.1 IclR family transcriptional regulator [Streptomyces sp. NBC_01336]